MDMLYNKLLNAASEMTNREHVKNIRNTKKRIKSKHLPKMWWIPLSPIFLLLIKVKNNTLNQWFLAFIIF